MSRASEYDLIRPKLTILISKIDAEADVLPGLVEARAISPSDKEKTVRRAREEGTLSANRYLLCDVLPRRSGWYEPFMRGLCEAGHLELVQELDETFHSKYTERISLVPKKPSPMQDPERVHGNAGIHLNFNFDRKHTEPDMTEDELSTVYTVRDASMDPHSIGPDKATYSTPDPLEPCLHSNSMRSLPVVESAPIQESGCQAIPSTGNQVDVAGGPESPLTQQETFPPVPFAVDLGAAELPINEKIAQEINQAQTVPKWIPESDADIPEAADNPNDLNRNSANLTPLVKIYDQANINYSNSANESEQGVIAREGLFQTHHALYKPNRGVSDEQDPKPMTCHDTPHDPDVLYATVPIPNFVTLGISSSTHPTEHSESSPRLCQDSPLAMETNEQSSCEDSSMFLAPRIGSLESSEMSGTEVHDSTVSTTESNVTQRNSNTITHILIGAGLATFVIFGFNYLRNR